MIYRCQKSLDSGFPEMPAPKLLLLSNTSINSGDWIAKSISQILILVNQN